MLIYYISIYETYYKFKLTTFIKEDKPILCPPIKGLSLAMGGYL